MNNDAPKFETVISHEISQRSEFEQPLYNGSTDSRSDLRRKCNWELTVENHCESYHLPWFHPSPNSYSRLKDHYNIERTSVYSGKGTRAYW